MSGLFPVVKQIPILTVNQSVPRRYGPAGRLKDSRNTVIERFQPTSGDARVSVRQRDAFVSLPTECRDSADGEIQSLSWGNPRGLGCLGRQAVSIVGSIPRVSRGAGAPWTAYGEKRVATNRLGQKVFHTSRSTIQAPDSSRMESSIGSVTCCVWTETGMVSGVQRTVAMIGFKSSNEAWIVAPRVLHDPGSDVTVDDQVTMAKTCVDGEGERFFVVVNTTDGPDTERTLRFLAYDTNGEELDRRTVLQNANNPGPGFWDITTRSAGGIYFAQPGAEPNGADVGTQIGQAVFDEMIGEIGLATSVDATIFCSGHLAWLTNDVDGLAYLATYVQGIQFVYAWQITNLAQSHSYVYHSLGGYTPDSIIGWVVDGALPDEPTVFVGYSVLSNFAPASGPLHDPALRYSKVISQNWDGDDLEVVRQINSVIFVSRAFLHNGEYNALTYYQSGSGLTVTQRSLGVANTAGDYMIGAPEQTVPVKAGDWTSGSPFLITVPASAGFDGIGIVTTVPTAAVGVLAGDQVTQVLSSGLGIYGVPDGIDVLKWEIANFTALNATYAGSRFSVLGTDIPSANSDWDIIGYGSGDIVYTSTTNVTGGGVAPGAFGAGGTAEIVSMTGYLWPALAENYDEETGSRFFIGGEIVVTDSAGGNDGTFPIERAISTAANSGSSFGVGPAIWTETSTQSSSAAGFTGLIAPDQPNRWQFTDALFDDSYQGMKLSIANDIQYPRNNQEIEVTANGTLFVTTGSAEDVHAQVFTDPLPDVKIRVPLDIITGDYLVFSLQDLTLDYTYQNAIVSVEDATHEENNGTYKIIQINADGTFYATPADGRTGQRNELFSSPVITIFFDNAVAPIFQPKWFMTPLHAGKTAHVGRFEDGIAYADWRMEGEEDIVNGNLFSMGVASVHIGNGDIQFVLPYRAESFTVGVPLVNNAGEIINAAQVKSESTAGLKKFSLSEQTGKPFQIGEELLIPGPLTALFTQSGFSEHGFNTSLEKPFIVTQSENEDRPALRRKGTYQIVFALEGTDENGDRIFSIPTAPLDFTMAGTNNSVTYGGRLPLPLSTIGAIIADHYGTTNRVAVSICGYRTSYQDNQPTTSRHKITPSLYPNSLAPVSAVNLSGFSFPNEYTWNYVDENPDVSILSSEELYTDKGFARRFPAPASRGGCVWKNRPWLIGADGALWMGGEKTEGDQTWFTSAFRFPQFDEPIAIAHNEIFLVVMCRDSAWYIPSTELPGANLSGKMPTPVRLQFTNGSGEPQTVGGSGVAITINKGVAYSSTAGGVWLITRDLQNIWLSSGYSEDLDVQNITDMAVDKAQRLHVTVGNGDMFVYDQVVNAWNKYLLPSDSARFLTTIDGQIAYQDDLAVSVYTPGQFLDIIDGSEFVIPPYVKLADISFASIRNFSHTWAFQAIGQYKGPHRLNARVSYPDQAGALPTVYNPYTPVTGAPYLVQFNPDPEECSLFEIELWADFEGVETPGDSFELDLIAAEVGIDLQGGINESLARTTK